MSSDQSNQVLNRLASLLESSLMAFMDYAKPWQGSGDESAVESIQHMAAEQRSMVARIAEVLDREGYTYDKGEIPMQFTAFFDLSLRYLLTQLVEHQQRDITSIGRCIELLDGAPLALALAEETLGLAEGHQENLRELVGGARNSVA